MNQRVNCLTVGIGGGVFDAVIADVEEVEDVVVLQQDLLGAVPVVVAVAFREDGECVRGRTPAVGERGLGGSQHQM